MKILLVTKYFLPNESASSNVIHKLVNASPFEESIVDVLCQTSTPGTSTTNYKRGKVFPIILFSEARIYSPAKKEKKIRTMIFSFKVLFAKAWKKILSKFLGYTPLIHSKKIAQKICKIIKENKYDLIVAISGDFSFCFGTYLANKKIAIDYGCFYVDPCFSNYTYNKSMRKYLKKKEALWLSKSKIHILPSSLFIDYSTTFFPGIQEYIDLPSFVDEKAFWETKFISPFTQGTINITFSGNFYLNIREPDYIFLLGQSLLNLNVFIHVIGETNKGILSKYKNIPTNIIFHTAMPEVNLYPYFFFSDCLLNLDNKVPNQIPSKVYTYISTGKPIINLFYDDFSPSKNILKDYPLVLNLSRSCSIEEAKNQILKFIKETKHMHLKPAYINGKFREFSTDYLSRNVFRIFDQLHR